MGTRSLTHVYDGSSDNTLLTTMYRQFDGYVSGHGDDLKSFLMSKRDGVLNGIRERGVSFNGARDVAAQLYANFVDGDGNFYCFPPGSSGCGEEYVYHVYAAFGEPIWLRVESVYDGVIYDGPVEGFDPLAPEGGEE